MFVGCPSKLSEFIYSIFNYILDLKDNPNIWSSPFYSFMVYVLTGQRLSQKDLAYKEWGLKLLFIEHIKSPPHYNLLLEYAPHVQILISNMLLLNIYPSAT